MTTFPAGRTSRPASGRLGAVALVATMLCWLPVFASAATVRLTAEGEHFELAPYLDVLEDPGGTLTAADALSPATSGAFKPAGAGVPNFGYTRSAYWVRFRIKNSLPPGGNAEWLLELAYPALDSITLAVQDGQGQVETRQAGDDLPFTAREVESRTFVFRLPVRPGEEKTVLIRIASTSSVQVPLSLWRPDAYRSHVQQMQFGFGMFYGFLCMMILYNAAAYLFVRDANHLFYIFQALAYGFYQFSMNGFAFQYLWPGLPELSNRSVPFGICLVCVSGTLFGFSFLNLREFLPRVYRLRWLVLAPSALIILFITAGPRRPAMLASVYCVIPYIVMIVALGGFMLWKGYRPARYFMIAWSGLLIGSSALVMSRLGFLPRTFWTEFGSQAGFAAEIFVLSIALTDRINSLTREKESAERRLSEERRRIARDLHDVAGSALTDMLLRIRYSADARMIAGFLEARMESVMRLMRDTIYLLNQPGDFSLQLETEIEKHAETMRAIDAFEVRLSLERTGHLLGAAESHHAYRIFLEWTANIVKHARPGVIAVRWMKKGDEVRLFIANDGGAFSWDGSGALGPGNGLRNIAERSAAIKARVRVWGLGNAYTLFLLRVPCDTSKGSGPQ